MILLDTHIWVWWADGGSQLPPNYQAFIQAEVGNGLAVSAISLWEVAKLVERGRLKLACPVDQWLRLAVQSPVHVLPISIEVAVGSTQLPGSFHRDPADQLIVATARVHSCPLVTCDGLIPSYPHVVLAP